MNYLKSPLTMLRSYKIPLIITAILCLTLSSAWYFLYFKNTPEYSLKQIRTAIEKHDVETFNKHVDLHTILASGYDDLMDIMIESDNNMSPDAKKMVLNFSQLLKAPVVAAFSEGITRYIQFGTWETEKNANKQQQNRALPDIHPEKIADKTGLQNTTYRGITYINQNDDHATVGLKIYESELKQEFVLDLQMTQLADGLWQVTEISNTREYLSAIAAAKQQALKDYLDITKAIVNTHQNNISQLQVQFAALSANFSDKNKQVLKDFLQNKLLPEWQAYKTDLEQISVPDAAQEISKLRSKMIDLQEEYIKKQIEDLDKKSPALDINLKTLSQQANELNYRIHNIINQFSSTN